MTRLLRWFHGLPRAGQWLVLLGVSLVGYFAVVEPVLDATATARGRVETLRSAIRVGLEGAGGAKSDREAVELGARLFGDARFPGEEKAGSEALSKRVADVLRSHGVREYTQADRRLTLTTGTLTREVGAEHRVERIVKDIQFEASPDALAAVLADLERSPEVSAISRLQFRKAGSGAGGRGASAKVLRANMAVETWVTVKKGRQS